MPQTFELNGAPLDLLDVGELALIHSNNKPFDMWLLDTFFPRRKSFQRDVVPIAELDIESDIAPLVAPEVAGRAFDPRAAAKVDFVQPAYLKPKNQVTPATSWETSLIARLRDTGLISNSNSLSVQDQYIIAQIETMKRNRDSIDNRKVLMAAELITTGQMVLESDDYKRNVVSFGRAAEMSFTPAIPWNQAGATPVDDIEAMLQLILDNDGGEGKIALMSAKVYAVLSANAAFKEKFVKPYEGISVAFDPQFNASDKAVMKGRMDNIEIWTYEATYREKGVRKRFVPQDFFAIIADNEGYVTQCQIKNIKAQGLALDYFEDQWYSNDPSGIMMLTESAPLIVPSNKNGICGGTGFITVS